MSMQENKQNKITTLQHIHVLEKNILVKSAIRKNGLI